MENGRSTKKKFYLFKMRKNVPFLAYFAFKACQQSVWYDPPKFAFELKRGYYNEQNSLLISYLSTQVFKKCYEMS
jgi:hypothetical protein